MTWTSYSTSPTKSRFCISAKSWNQDRPKASRKATGSRKSIWGPTDAMAILDVQDVHTYYGDAYVLQGLSLQLEQGQILGLLGRNGVGKTTDRKSTRLNSSHLGISYAVFCLKKKT